MNNRLARIEEELKREISNIINYELNNSNITGMVSITKIKVTPDLRFARVYVSMINGRTTPEFIFEFDESLEYGAKIDSILKDIIKDVKPKEGEE